jgi:hypothetical protein
VKFLVTKELHQNPLLTLLVKGLVGFFTLFLALDLLLHHFQIGLTLTKAKETLLGNEEAFIEPILLDALIERIHVDIFMMMILLTLLAIIYMRVITTPNHLMLHTLFISTIVSFITLILGYFYGEIFIMTWIGLFALSHLIAWVLCAKVLWSLR